MYVERQIQDQQQVSPDIGSVVTLSVVSLISMVHITLELVVMLVAGLHSWPLSLLFVGISQRYSTCQICGQFGHSTINCYNRLNLSFEGRGFALVECFESH